MGSSLYPRRKRRHKKLLGGGGGKRCAISLPWVAVLVGLGMIAVVVVRKGIKASAREAAKAVERREKRAYPLAVLLEQHDIDDQVCVAGFAGPLVHAGSELLVSSQLAYFWFVANAACCTCVSGTWWAICRNGHKSLQTSILDPCHWECHWECHAPRS